MNPNRLTVLIVTGQGPCGMSHMAPKNVTGMPTITQPATFQRRNTVSRRQTSSAPCSMFWTIMFSWSCR